MKTLAVLAHPERNSFNGALYDVAQRVFSNNGHEFKGSDLYRLNFNPISDRHNFKEVKDAAYFKPQIEEMHASETGTFSDDIAAEMEKLFWADLLILQFPLWWFSVPAIMKGWVDRVFAMGKIYGAGKWYDNGVFAGKKAMLSLTTGGGETMYMEDGMNGHLEQILFPINHGILRFVGFEVLPPFISYSVSRIGDEGRAQYLSDYEKLLLDIESVKPIQYPPLSDFDESFRLKSKAPSR